jgi:hypothetical protein
MAVIFINPFTLINGNITSFTTNTITPTSLNLNIQGTYSYIDISYNGIKQYSQLPYTNTAGITQAISGLTTNTSYTFTAIPYSNNGSIYPAGAVNTSSVTMATVGTLSTSNITATGATLSWISGSQSSVDISYNGATQISTVTGNTTNITGLTSNTRYIFSIIPKNSAVVPYLPGIQSASSILTLATDGATSLTNITPTTLTLNWVNLTDTNVDISYNGITQQTSVFGSSTNITGLTSNASYTFAAIPKNSDGVPNTVGLQTSTTVTMATVGALTITNIGQTTATLNWITGTQSSVDISYNGTTQITTVTGNTSNITGLNSNATYIFSVIPKNSALVAYLAGAQIATSILTYATVGVASTTSITPTTLTLNWVAGSQTSVDISYNNATQYTTVAGTTQAITGLTSNTSYTFGVIPKNSAVVAYPSGVQTTTVVTMATVGAASISYVTDTIVTLNWISGSQTSIDISYNNATQYTNISGNKKNLSGLSSNVSYTFTIIPKNSAVVAYTAGQQTTTIVTMATVGTLSVTNLTNTTLTLNWIAGSQSSVDISYNNATQFTAVTGRYQAITGLTSGTNYTFWVIPVNSAGIRYSAGKQIITITTSGSSNGIIVSVPIPSANNYITTNLIGYWDFSSTRSGTTLTDLSPNGNNLTFNTAPTYNSSGAMYATFTSSISAVSSAITVNFNSTGLTFELLIYPTSSSSTNVPIAWTDRSTGSSSILYALFPSGALNQYLYINGNGSAYSSSLLTLNTWNHIVCTCSGSTTIYYLNGVYAGTSTTSNPLLGSVTQYLTLGVWQSGGSQGFIGNIGMARVYSSVLSASQVSQNFYAVALNLSGNPYYLPGVTYPPISLGSGNLIGGTTQIFPVYSSIISGQNYGNGTYYISASSTDASNGSDAPIWAFNKSTGTAFTNNIWGSNGPVYSASSPYTYINNVTTTINGINISGEWLQIQLPSQIILISYSIQTRSDGYYQLQGPGSWYLAGSNDGYTWNQLDYQAPTVVWQTGSSINTYAISNNTAYNCYRLVIANNGGYNQYTIVGELTLYGISLSTTSYVNTNLMLNYDMSNGSYTGSGTSLIDKTNNIPCIMSVNGSTSTTGWSYNIGPPSYLSWTNTNVYGVANIPSTNFYTTGITFELLLYATSININPGPTIAFVGTAYNNYINNVYITGSNTITFVGSSSMTTNTYTIPVNTWVHIIVSVSSASSPSSAIYINGVSQSVSSTSVTANSTSCTVYELNNFNGGSFAQPGNIAIARLYNTGLTAAQALQNYNSIVSIIGNPYFPQKYPSISIPQSNWTPPNNMSPCTYTISGQNTGNGTYVISNSTLPLSAYNSTWLYNGNGNQNTNTCLYYQNGPIWTQIQLPAPIYLTGYTIWGTANYGYPSSYYIQGSNDSVNWFYINGTSSSSLSFPGNFNNLTTGTGFIYVYASTAYSYFRIYFNGGGNIYLSQIAFYGLPSIKQYPPIALTSNAGSYITGQGYGNGLYICNQSSTWGSSTFDAFHAFDYTIGSDGTFWGSGGGSNSFYNSTTGAYTGTATLNGILLGEWISIQLPTSIKILSYKLTIRNDGYSFKQIPNSWTILGSNDGTTWISIDIETNQGNNFNTGQYNSYNINNPGIYSYYAIVIQTIIPNGVNTISIGEWQLLDSYLSSYQYTTSNLLGYYNFYNGSSYSGTGININDLSIYNNTLTISGSINYSSNAVTFLGGYARSLTNLSTFTSTGITLEIVAKYNNNTGGFQRLFGVDNFSYGNDYCCFSTGGNPTALYLSCGGTQLDYISSSYGSGGWIHLVFTITPFNISTTGIVSQYANGSLITSGTINNLSGGTDNVFIGLASNLQGGGVYQGLIALARIYNTALSASQVLQNYYSIINSTNLNYFYPLDSLTRTAKYYLRGCYSLKTLFTNSASYPVIQLSTSSSGGTTTDYYGNIYGNNLTTGAYGTGTPLLPGIYYVSIWYDQSQYVNGGTAYNATASTRPILNMNTMPWCVDSSNGNNGYFNLPYGTIVGNGTFTFSSKVNATNGSGCFIGGGNTSSNNANGLRFCNYAVYGIYNFFWNNDIFCGQSYQLAAGSPIIGSVVNYVDGSAPTTTTGIYYTGGNTSTVYNSVFSINSLIPTSNYITTNGGPNYTTYTTRTGWNYIPGNDTLMTAPSGPVLASQMYWCVNSSQAMCNADRLIIEAIDPPIIYQLDNLTSKSYIRGCFSLRVLFYAAANNPIIQLATAPTGGTTQNFYGNSTGILLTTLSNGYGSTVTQWMSINNISTAYVSIWYDQSQYVNGGIAYNATASTRPTLNMTTLPWSVDSTSNYGYFTLPAGTIPLNSSYTLSTKINAGPGIGILGGGTNSNNQCNNLKFNGSNCSFQNYWFYNDYNFNNSSGNSTNIIVSVVNYVTGSSPSNIYGSYFTGGSSSTNYTTAGYIAGIQAISNPTTTRNNWTGIVGTDYLGKTTADSPFGSQMFWAFISSQAICNNDRSLIENIDLVQYPPIGLTGSSTTISNQAYGNGIYNVTSSSYANTNAWALFDYIYSGSGYNGCWQSNSTNINGANYSTTTGACIQSNGIYAQYITNPGLAGQYGDWVQIQFPFPIICTNYTLYPRQDSPWYLQMSAYNWFILGSNNGSSYNIVDIQKGITGWNGATGKTFVCSNPGSYTYYVYLVTATQINNNYGCINMAEWQIFGKLNNSNYIATNLIAYWDFTNSSSYPGSGTTITDLAGNYNLSLSGGSFNSYPAYMTFASNTYAYIPNISLNVSSGGVTYEVLIYPTSTTAYRGIMGFNNTSGNLNYALLLQTWPPTVNGGSLTYCVWQNNNNNIICGPTSNVTQPVNTWLHVVITITAQSNGNSTYQWYINGSAITNSTNDNVPGSSTISTDPLPNGSVSSNLVIGDVSLGNNNGFAGNMALGRIYNIPLTASQVTQNYNSLSGKGYGW